MTDGTFRVRFRDTDLVGDRVDVPGAAITALMLHGGGTSTAGGFAELRAHLHARGVATAAFDAVGHGRTGGAQPGTTLKDRVEQVLGVVRQLALDPARLALVGFSMGAYVAAKAAAERGVPRLCLAIPAAYDERAYAVPFGPAFTRILRTPGSWEASDSFGLVNRFRGHLLVVSAEKDAVVPAAIPARYLREAANAASARHLVVAGAGHQLNAHYAADPGAQQRIYDAIAELCVARLPAGAAG